MASSLQQEEGKEAMEMDTQTLRMWAETTALLMVDVQPMRWFNCPAMRKDFLTFHPI
jgi:hypothetical protein